MTQAPESEPAPFRLTAGVLILVYVFLIVVSLVASYRLAPFTATGGFENFSKVAGVLVAAASALMAAVVTIINFDRNAKDARNLARLNGEISQSLADYKADLDRKLLQDKVGADFKLKRLETTYSKKVDAYLDLITAARKAYNLVEKMQSGKFTRADKDKLEEVMSEASSKTSALDEKPHADLWEKIWQQANFMIERAEDLATPSDQPAFWREKVGELSSLVQQFQEISASKLHEQL